MKEHVRRAEYEVTRYADDLPVIRRNGLNSMDIEVNVDVRKQVRTLYLISKKGKPMNPINFFCDTCNQAKRDPCVNTFTGEPFPMTMFHKGRIRKARLSDDFPESIELRQENFGCPQAFRISK